MRVAFIHYHLRGGGVTRVIRHAAEVLGQNGGDYIVFSGEAPASNDIPPDRVCVLPELAYGKIITPNLAKGMARELEDRCQHTMQGQPDVWHFHNHALGKNITIPLLVEYMSANNYPLLLQLHDFAEDNRPGNYEFLTRHLELPNKEKHKDSSNSHTDIYPQSGRVHYAVLNKRDQRFLATAGACNDRLTVLPNAVWFERDNFTEEPVTASSRPLHLYPGRGIRRKNIGEFIFWSIFNEDDGLFAITLAPQNPGQRPAYDRWVEFSQEHNLPVAFNYGPSSGLPFSRLLKTANTVITTSIREGFGLAFVEPWTLGTPVYGRDLPGITEDFKENGVNLDCLYKKLLLPNEWVDKAKLYNKIKKTGEDFWKSYGRRMPADFPDKVTAAAEEDEMLDFARLDEEMQEDIIRQILKSDEKKKSIRPRQFSANGAAEISCIRHNAEIIDKRYSLAAFSQRLLGLYRQVANSEPRRAAGISAQSLLDCFMSPEQFYLLNS